MKNKLVLISALLTGIALFVFFGFFLFFNTGISKQAKALTTETISTGSYIINMGIAPTTKANSLLPYGMVYELNATYNVPVKWVISQTKVKDGADFIHNGITYKGGTFIIPAAFITPTIAARIEYWSGRGVVGNYSVTDITVPVYMDITAFPRIMIDNLSGNDSIIVNYLTNSGIPAAAYEINSPSYLNACHDIWINPHGDPTWSTHQYLYDFVTVQKSYIWMQCHAVSMMEYCKEPVAPFRQLNYLTTNGLQCYLSGKCGTNPEVHAKPLPGTINYYYPGDPVMQFMGSAASIASNGSEKWFVPMSTGGWRSTTKRLAVTGTYASPKEGIIMAYGPAFGDTTNGLVMYTGGHDMNETAAAGFIAGQRSFMNFLLLAGRHKAPALQADVAGNMNANAVDTFSVTVSGGTAPYTYQWTSNVGGTFSDPNGPVTVYNSFHTETPTATIVTCVVTDACGRRNFFSQPLLINASPLPINLLDFTAKIKKPEVVTLNWITATEINNNYFTISRSPDGKNFTPWKNIPGKGTTSTTVQYTIDDLEPLKGKSYYRLEQTDYDGTHYFLKTVIVQGSGSEVKNHRITVQPNPFQDYMYVRYFSENESNGHVKIWNAAGRIVHDEQVRIDEGWNQFEMNVKNEIPGGIYVLRVINGDSQSEAVKIVKK